MASLAQGESRVVNSLVSRDTNATVAACESFGAEVVKTDGELRITGSQVLLPDNIVNVENSGTTLRFLTSALSLAPEGYSILTGDESIRRRPMQPLLDALGHLGVEAWSSRANGCAPVVVKGGGMRGGEAWIRGDMSSQFVSSLIVSAPMAAREVTVKVESVVSKPYIDATIAMMSTFGVSVEREGYETFRVASGQAYRPCEITVPADLSSASFIAAAVALVGGRVELRGLDFSLPQGDARIAEILRSMGAEVRKGEREMLVESEGGPLQGGSFDLSDTPDLLPVVAVLALKSRSPVEVYGVGHARYKETDRVAILAAELKKLGVMAEERRDGLSIRPGAPRPAALDAHDDHRLFMAFVLASLLFPGGAPVAGAESLDVSYPTFLADLARMGAVVRRTAG